MNRHSRPRRTADLSDSTHQQLTMYAVAAAAAGVGMLALAQPSEAKIVYTPANAQIGGAVGKLNLDLNHDGITDFEFCVATNYRYCPGQPGRRTSAGEHRQAPLLTVYRFFPRSRLTESGENQPLVHLPSLRVSAWGPKESSYRPKLSWPRGSMAAQRSTVVLGQTCSTDILG